MGTGSYTKRAVWLMTETGLTLLSRRTVPYDGPWAFCKGDPTAQASEQQQMGFNQQLMQIFQAQYGQQTATLKYLQGKMQPIIDAGGQGYSPQALAAMRTSTSDQNSTTFQNAQAALQNQISDASGGSKLTGVAGANVEARAALLNQEAMTEANSQNQITQANENLKQSNYWNAINVLNGTSAQFNPLGYAGAANQGGDTVANLSEAYKNSQSSQLLGALGGVLGGAAGAAAIGKIPCWIAATFWGWHGLKTWVVRQWIQNRAPAWFRKFYLRHGRWIASTPLRWAFRPLFEYVLWVS